MVKFIESVKSALSKRVQKEHPPKAPTSRDAGVLSLFNPPRESAKSGNILPETSLNSDSRDARGSSDKIERYGLQQTAPPLLAGAASSIPTRTQKLSESSNMTSEVNFDNTQDVPRDKPTPISTASLGLDVHVPLLWNAAYNSISAKNQDLLSWYEQAVFGYTTNGGHLISHQPSGVASNGHLATQTDHHEIQTLMDNCLHVFLKKACQSVGSGVERGEETEDSPGQDMNGSGVGVGEYETGHLRDKLAAAVRKSQYASLAWVASCLNLESLLHPSILPQPGRSGAVAILTKMEWYIDLPKFLLQRDNVEELSIKHQPLAQSLVHLYEVILSYQMGIVCHQWTSSASIIEIDFKKYEDEIRIREEALMCFNGQEFKTLFTQTVVDNTARSTKDILVALDERSETRSIPDSTRSIESHIGRIGVVEQPNVNIQPGKSSESDILYRWVCGTKQYQTFIAPDATSNERVLWLKSDHGAGKTRLLRAIQHGLIEDERSGKTTKMAYFSYDSSISWQENASSAVRTLIDQIIEKQSLLKHHLTSKYTTTGRKAFKDPNDFYAMTNVMYSMLNDALFQPTYLVVNGVEQLLAIEDIGSDTRIDNPDGTDSQQAVEGPRSDDFLTLIFTTVQVSNKIRWLVSHSSERSSIQPRLAGANMRLHLTAGPEVDEIRKAISNYVAAKVAEIADEASFTGNLREILTAKAQAAPKNFLWLSIALNTVKMSRTPWNAPEIMEELTKQTSTVVSMFENRLNKMSKRKWHDWDYCRDALYTTALAYRPLLDTELRAIIDLPLEVDLQRLVNQLLMPFLWIQEDKVSNGRKLRFASLAARDSILQELNKQACKGEISRLTKRCLSVLLGNFTSREHNTKPVNGSVDPRHPVDYVTTFWMRHLSEKNDDTDAIDMATRVLQDYLVAWVEVLESRNLQEEATVMIAKLDSALTTKSRRLGVTNIGDINFHRLVMEAGRFLTTHQRWKATSDVSGRNGDDIIRPKNSLLFSPIDDSIAMRLLPRFYPWLKARPVIGSGVATSSDNSIMSHPDYVRACAFSPTGSLVASACDDRRVRLWDVETGNLQSVLEGFGGYVYSVVISHSGPDGHALLASSDARTIRIWDLCTGMDRTVLDHHNKPHDVQNGDVNEGEDGRKDPVSDNCEEIGAHSENKETQPDFTVMSISITRDGRRLAAATGDGLIVWDISSHKGSIWHDDTGSKNVRRVAFSQNGDLLASTARSEITIWDAVKGTVKHRLPGRGQTRLGEVSEGESTKVNAEEAKLNGHSEDIDGLDFSPDGKFLASGSHDSTARIWNVEDGTSLAVLHHKSWVNSVSFSADGVSLATGSSDKTIGIWIRDPRYGWAVTKLQQFLGDGSVILSVVFAPTGMLLASAATSGDLRIWDTQAAKTKIEVGKAAHSEQSNRLLVAGHTQRVKYVEISPCGTKIASASNDYVLCLWDALAFSPDGTQLISASASSANNAFIWSIGDTCARKIHSLHGHQDWVRAVAFSPNGKLVATGSDDRSVILWDISKSSGGIQFRKFNKHTDWVFSVAFSPDGHRLASAGDDGHVMIWDLDKNDPNPEPDKDLKDDRLSRRTLGLVFSPDGASVLSINSSGDLAVWKPDTSETKACILEVDASGFTSIRINKDDPDVLLSELGACKFRIGEALRGRVNEKSQPPSHSMPPPWAPVAIKDRKRIMWNNRQVILLPVEFRPTSCRVQGHSVVIGCESGQVLLFRFSEKIDPDTISK
ncbi:WD40-repeat-containing domain protein [Xylaria bambusicola]|uniref:WD40-repeat-containing domain protein n=1 Tax=Xylaria bambusicola TaxID=326684 RepID=UPI002007610F|nr:WD40-repeat-containing domain protein [Xylaria bambusicola]KAI0526727.1 WD40-repeat-containing domain protein [Xylaria bambusicola]